MPPEIDDYLSAEHTPFSSTSQELYINACEDLLIETPAVALKSYPLLQQMTGGLRPKEFTILCGATGTGKTTLCANLSKDFILQKVPHFVASVETGHVDFMRRVMSAMVEQDWNTGDPITLEQAKDFHSRFGAHFTQNPSLFLSLYEDRFSVKTLMADIAWHVKNKGVKVAIIDNLNFFLEVTRAADQLIEMDRVIHDLIIFCKKVPVHVIMVMHPKKTEGGRVESEFDIKGSSTAVQEAHNVLLFNRIHPDLVKAEQADPNDRDIVISKMRRRGKYVRRRLVLKSIHGVTYAERNLF